MLSKNSSLFLNRNLCLPQFSCLAAGLIKDDSGQYMIAFSMGLILRGEKRRLHFRETHHACLIFG
jgi:hypothetical protein